jgi:hypothetical protein
MVDDGNSHRLRAENASTLTDAFVRDKEHTRSNSLWKGSARKSVARRFKFPNLTTPYLLLPTMDLLVPAGAMTVSSQSSRTCFLYWILQALLAL